MMGWVNKIMSAKRRLKSSFSKKIFLIMFLLCMVVLLISSAVIMSFSAKLLKQDAIRYNQRMTEELSSNIYTYFYDVEMRLSKIYALNDAKYALKLYKKDNQIESSMIQFAKDFYIEQLSDIDEVVGVNLFTCDDRCYSSYRKGHSKKSVMNLWTDNRVSKYHTLEDYWKDTGNKIYVYTYFDESFNCHIMRIGIKIIDIYSGDYLGTLIIDRYAQEFAEMIQKYVLYDDQQFSLSDSESMVLYPLDTVKTVEVKSEKDLVSLNISISKYKNLMLFSSFPVRSIEKNYYNTLSVVFITVGLLLFIALVTSLLFSRSLTYPLQELIKKMELVKSGNNETKIEIKSNDEIGELATGLNQLVARIVELVNHEYEQNIAINKTKLKALQAQINPHFLHNTFQVMGSIARKYNAPILNKMCMSLSAMFRYNLDMKNLYTTIGEELEHARNYFFIQSIRFNNEINYEVKCDVSVYEIKVPRLIIQPLLENAIEHGLRNKNGPKNILLSIIKDNDILRISIQDNGCGMDENQLDQLNSVDEETILERDNSIGIRNVRERIRLTYKTNGSMIVKSKQGEGTEIVINIPCAQEGKSFA